MSDRVREKGHSVCELGTKNGRNGAYFVVQMWATQKKAVVSCAGRNSDYTDYLQVDVIPKDKFSGRWIATSSKMKEHCSQPVGEGNTHFSKLKSETHHGNQCGTHKSTLKRKSQH